ncbi:MAG: hypothetical protein GWN01_05475 [Nitrosopumilaceae archaeon]|nr:hypothetical protein [Nitrosopumilaceae archaeon]NIU86795.1 hypothetical protein [Nitrosopumilaceae archaeon]NIX60995.1 hypothetical protein [Nitrosopumilaceae archaeon]
MILDSDYNTLTIQKPDGEIIIRNIDEYNILKYKDFKGKRIIKKWKHGKVEETYNDGIFNVVYKDYAMQIRDKIEVCKRLKYAMENRTLEPIKDLLLERTEKEIKDDILKRWLLPFLHRLRIDKNGVTVDDIFKVDMNGQAYKKDSGKWTHLCIVASETGKINNKVKHELGEIKIDFRTMEIYNKVLFLLFPNQKDTVFMNQLPGDVKYKMSEIAKCSI